MKKQLLLLFTTVIIPIFGLAQQIPNDYVAFYEFTNGSNTNSASGNTYPLTNIDVACQYTDRFNNANSAYMPNCGNENNGYRLIAGGQPVTDYSISFWYKSNVHNTTNRQIIAFKEVNSTNTFAFSFLRINNLYYVFVNYGGITINANLYTTSNLLNDGNWHNIVLSIDGFGVNNLPNGQNIYQYDATLYVDNVLHTSASSTLDAINNNDPYYGTPGLPTLELVIAPIVLNQQNGGNVNDSVDDILVYDRAISQSEVNDVYNAASCTSNVNIPDANFKTALLDHGVGITGDNISVIDTDGDGEICITEAQAYTGVIDVHNKNISDLTGIEAFANASRLYCKNNQLTSLDVSANTALTHLVCDNNNLSSLDVSLNTNLELLHCYSNNLNSLDVSQNISLMTLFCHRNNLSNLDVTQNTDLIRLYTNENNLSSLDVSLNTNLRILYCYNNNLSDLNVANGNNGSLFPELIIMNAINNPNLTCIEHDTGFNPTTNSDWVKDAAASWSDDCASLSLADFNTKNDVKLYPNPTTSTITISSVSTIESAIIYSVLGKEVLRTNSNTIDVSSLKSGVYFITINSEKGYLQTKRFIKE